MCCLIASQRVMWSGLLCVGERQQLHLSESALLQSWRVGGVSWGTEHPQIVMLFHSFVAVCFKTTCSILP